MWDDENRLKLRRKIMRGSTNKLKKQSVGQAFSFFSKIISSLNSSNHKSEKKWYRFMKDAGICARCWTHTHLLVMLVLSFSTAQVSAQPITGRASWYSTECCRYNVDPVKCPTASGRSLYELERSGTFFAASWDYRIGERVEVCNLKNQKCVTVAVLERGPAKRLRRSIDLGKKAFEKIADPSIGLINVTVRKVTPQDSVRTGGALPATGRQKGRSAGALPFSEGG